jgi:phage terminase large subunit
MLQSALGMSNVRIVPNLSLMDGVQATRKMLQTAVFDTKTEDGVEACKQYRYTWKDETRTFSVVPLHDWTSHHADALRMAAIAWKEEYKPPETPKPKFWNEATLEQLWEQSAPKRNRI